MMSVSSVCYAETHLPCICLDSLISPPCSTNYEDVEMSKDIADKYRRSSLTSAIHGIKFPSRNVLLAHSGTAPPPLHL